MAEEESEKPVGALVSRMNSTAQMYVLVGKNVSTVTTKKSHRIIIKKKGKKANEMEGKMKRSMNKGTDK